MQDTPVAINCGGNTVEQGDGIINSFCLPYRHIAFEGVLAVYPKPPGVIGDTSGDPAADFRHGADEPVTIVFKPFEGLLQLFVRDTEFRHLRQVFIAQFLGIQGKLPPGPYVAVGCQGGLPALIGACYGNINQL